MWIFRTALVTRNSKYQGSHRERTRVMKELSPWLSFLSSIHVTALPQIRLSLQGHIWATYRMDTVFPLTQCAPTHNKSDFISGSQKCHYGLQSTGFLVCLFSFVLISLMLVKDKVESTELLRSIFHYSKPAVCTGLWGLRNWTNVFCGFTYQTGHTYQTGLYVSKITWTSYTRVIWNFWPAPANYQHHWYFLRI